MEIKVMSLTEDAVEERDYRDVLKIEVDGKRVFGVHDGEPEDATLGRDFNDCWKIPELMKMAHEAGAKGEKLEVKIVQVDEV